MMLGMQLRSCFMRTSCLALPLRSYRASRRNMFIPTMKEEPLDVTIPSHKLLLRAGYMRQLSSGCYTYLPLGVRVLDKLKMIIDEELAEENCSKVDMPSLMSKQLWDQSGRWDAAGPELFTLSDRHEKPFCLGPTHEEAVTMLVTSEVASYKQLPLRLYQITKKFRDEARPRSGLLRAREFYMKDLYSFDQDKTASVKTYEDIRDAYMRIFTRMGVKSSLLSVEADSGAIGGSLSHEYHLKSESGEDTLFSCTNCDYAANVEKAVGKILPRSAALANSVDVDETAVHLDALPSNAVSESLKMLLDNAPAHSVHVIASEFADTPLGFVVIPEGREVNPFSLKQHLPSSTGELAVLSATAALKWFQGPNAFNDPMIAFVDTGLTSAGLACPAEGNLGYRLGNFRQVRPNDGCTRCKDGVLSEHRGIEIGHVFQLGDKYSAPFKASFTSKQGKVQNIEMGCYGIGVSRVMSAIAEVNCGDNARIMAWPWNVAPYRLCIITGNAKLKVSEELKAEIAAAGELLYELSSSHVSLHKETMLDDRPDVSLGFKLKDAQLIGFPAIAVLGSSMKNGLAEVLTRRARNGVVEMQKEFVPVKDVPAYLETQRQWFDAV